MQATEVKGPVELPAAAAEQAEAPAAEEPPPAARAEAAACCGVQSGKTSSRPWLIGAALLGIPLALWGGWDWLAATGLATILIGVAPCLAMCALGLCMGRGKKAGPSLTDIRKTYETQSGEPPSRG